MKQLFREMPDSILPILSHDNRLDCIDYIESGMAASVKNNFGENSRLVRLTDDFVKLELTESTTYQLKWMKKGNDSLVCLVKTYYLPTPISEVLFYDVNWNRLEVAPLLTMPTIKDFLVLPEGRTSEEQTEALSHAGLPLVEAQLTEEHQNLIFKISVDDNNPELRRQLAAFIVPQLIYEWKEGRWVKQ